MRADIAMRSSENIANSNFTGHQQWGQSVGSGIAAAGSSLAQGIAAAGQAYQQNKAQRAANDGTADAMMALGYGTQDFWEAFSKTKDEDKRSGMLATGMGAIQQAMQHSQRTELLEREYQLRAGLEAAAQTRDRTGQSTVMTDPVTGAQVGGYFQNNRQVVPFDVPTAAAGSHRRIDLGGGAHIYVDGQGRPIPASAVITPPEDAASTALKANLDREIAALSGQVQTRGADAKDGPNWWPFAQTLGTRLDQKRIELKALTTEPDMIEHMQQPAATPTPQQPQELPVVTSKEQWDALPSGARYRDRHGTRRRKP
jgi:hypothetical protein